jgi:hypothetical protein
MNRQGNVYSALRRVVMICRTMRLDVETALAKTIMATPKILIVGQCPHTEFIRGGVFAH